MNEKDKQERIQWLKNKLKEMSEPGYYGAWCAGYLKQIYKDELKRLMGN